MKPIPPLLLMALLPLVAQAQVPTSSSPTATRSATTVAPQPVVPPPQTARPQPQVLPSPQPTQPIKSTGPAQVAPAPVPKPADKVYDRNGRIVPGCARPARTACSTRAPAAITTACRPAMASRSSVDLQCESRWAAAAGCAG